MLKAILCILGAIAVLFLVLLAGVVLAFAQLYIEAPDLYEQWNGRREERKGKQ